MSKESVMVTFMNGPADGRSLIINGPSVSIGRGSDNDVVIDFDPNVADKHLQLLNQKGQWLFVDCAEIPGVFMDGMLIQDSSPLIPDRLVSLGSTQLMFNVTGNA